LWVRPGSKKSRFEKYREAWDLMRAAGESRIAPDCLACVFVQVWQTPEMSAEPGSSDSSGALAPTGTAAGVIGP